MRPTPGPKADGTPYVAPTIRWPNITKYPTVTRQRMWGKGANQPVEVDIYSIAPGEEDGLHYHPDHVELVICWRGSCKVTLALPKSPPPGSDWTETVGWQPPFDDIVLTAGDTILVPKRALHSFTADASGTMYAPNPRPVDPQKNKIWPVEKTVLIVIHTKGSSRVPDLTDTRTLALPTGTTKTPVSDDEPHLPKRPIGKYSGFERDPWLQSVRTKFWGRDAELPGGAADEAKSSFHFTVYTFVPKQENPEHYHPDSNELIICVAGRARVTVRPLIDRTDFSAGWEESYDERIMMPGDSVLVPNGALHWYETAGNEDLILLAMQVPHPILHIYEDDCLVRPAKLPT